MSMSGKTVVFTGKLSLKRVDMEREAHIEGIFTQASVKRGVDYLICGDDAKRKQTVKYRDALRLGISVLTEDEYRNYLKGNRKTQKPKKAKKEMTLTEALDLNARLSEEIRNL